MIGNHIVMRTLFGFDPKLARVTGFIRCDELTSRFADKSAIIEDEKFEDFNVNMKKFILEIVIPSLLNMKTSSSRERNLKYISKSTRC